jgi:hypothetical protein
MEKDEAEKGSCEAGTCPICFEDYNEALHLPRLLHCGHSFCTQCLTDLSSSTTAAPPAHHTITCPKCRALTHLGGLGGFGGDDVQGVQALPRNFDLLDVLTQMTATAKAPKLTACEAHKGKRLKYWCDQDDSAVCTSCLLVGAHQGHKAVPIDEAAAMKAKREAADDVSQLKFDLMRVGRELANVEARSANARECAASSRIAVHRHFAWLKAALAQREDELEKELRAWEDKRAHAMQDDHAKLSKVKQELEVACELMQAIETHPSVGLLVASGEIARRRATALKAREAASPHLPKPFGGRPKVCEESIALHADGRSTMLAISGVMLLSQSSANNMEIKHAEDDDGYLELSVVVLGDLERWHQADLWSPELVLFPLAHALPSTPVNLTALDVHVHSHARIVRVCACVRACVHCMGQIKKFKVKKNSTLKQFKAIAAEEFGIPKTRQRYWGCPPRRNRTIRPDSPFSAEREQLALEKLVKRGAPASLLVFLEASPTPVEGKLPRRYVALIFFKYYDPEAEEKLRFVCSLFVKIADPIASVLPHLRRALATGPEQELLLFEEIKPSLVDRLEDISTTTFTQAELSNGDIICVQTRRQACNLAPAHYARLLEVTIKFRNLNKLDEDVCALKLYRTATYEEVMRELSAQLKQEPGKLRIMQHSAMYKGPHVQPIDHNSTMALTNMLTVLHSPKGHVLTDIFERK